MKLRLRILNRTYKNYLEFYGSAHPETIQVQLRWLEVADDLLQLYEDEDVLSS